MSIKKQIELKLKNFFSSERKHIFYASSIFIFILFSIFLFGQIKSTDTLTYNGGFFTTGIDYPIHISQINQVKNGDIFTKNHFTIEPQEARDFSIIPFITGIIAKIFSIEAWSAFFTLKIILLPIAILAIYNLLQKIINESKIRIYTFWFILFSGNIGAFAMNALKTNPHENLKIIELTTTFSQLSTDPDLIISIILISYIFLYLITALKKNNATNGIIAGVIGAIMFYEYPLAYLPINLTILLYYGKAISSKKSSPTILIKTYLAWFCLSTIPLVYHFLRLSSDVFLTIKSRDEILKTPSIPIMLAMFGIILALAISTWRAEKQKTKDKKTYDEFLYAWIIGTILCIYIPITKQGEFIKFLYPPLNILAFGIIWKLFHPLPQKLHSKKRYLIAMTCLIFLTEPTHMIYRELKLIAKQEPSHFFSKDLLSTSEWLSRYTDSESHILTPAIIKPDEPNLGSWIAALSGRKTLIAHPSETIFFQEKNKLLQELVNRNNSTDWNNFYKNFNLNYLVVQNTPSNAYYNTAFLQAVHITPTLITYRIIDGD